MIVGLGINRVTEVFSFVGRAVSFGYNALCDVLDAVGLPYEIYFLLIIGFFVTYFVVGSVRDYWLGSADSVLSASAQAKRRIDSVRARNEATARHAVYMKAYQARTDMYRERNQKLLEYWNDRHFQKWRDS